MKTTLVLAAALCCGSVYAGLYSDDFNRANTSAGDASVIGNGWVDTGNGGAGDWAIWNNRLQFKGATAWSPGNMMYNSSAITDSGDFTLKMDLIPNHAAAFADRLGVVWSMGAHEGGTAIDDGFAIRLGDDSYQILRIKNGGAANLGTGAFTAMTKGTSYTLTIDATGNRAWDFSLDVTGGANVTTFSGADPSGAGGSGSWGTIDGNGGLFYNVNIWQSSADNFSVESPSSIPEPATLVLVGIAGLGLAATRRFRIN